METPSLKLSLCKPTHPISFRSEKMKKRREKSSSPFIQCRWQRIVVLSLFLWVTGFITTMHNIVYTANVWQSNALFTPDQDWTINRNITEITLCPKGDIQIELNINETFMGLQRFPGLQITNSAGVRSHLRNVFRFFLSENEIPKSPINLVTRIAFPESVQTVAKSADRNVPNENSLNRI